MTGPMGPNRSWVAAAGVALAAAVLTLTGCSGTSSAGSDAAGASAITAEDAIQVHLQTLWGGSLPNCYAPVDWGTPEYDRKTVSVDEWCWRAQIVNAAPAPDGSWCVDEAKQDTYKWSDAEGFNIGPVEVTRFCYQIESADGGLQSTYLGGMPAGTLASWPGSAAASVDSPTQQDTSAAEAVGTGGALIPIQSDNVSAAGYDAASQTMYVRFDSGETYEYAPVSADLWNRFIVAQPHPWSEVGYPELVQAGVPYRKIG